jgi:hypothetical protein
VYFHLQSWVLLVVLLAVVGGTIALGIVAGRRLRARTGGGHEPVGVVQGALLGLVGLLLAFGLTMAVGRYEARRALVVKEANTIGTAYLRAQLLAEPQRSTSLRLYPDYADAAIAIAEGVPDTPSFDRSVVRIEDLQRDLWGLAGEAMAGDPIGSASRLYVEALNEMIDTHAERVTSLGNRVPSTVMVVLVLGSAIALGVLALYLTMLGRGVAASLLAAGVVILILFVSFDLDRPRRGLITVPYDPLIDVRASMDQSPAAAPP